MSWLLAQLWSVLLVAFAIGALFGWLLKSWRAQRVQRALEDAGARCSAQQAEQERLRKELEQLKERLRSAPPTSSGENRIPAAPADVEPGAAAQLQDELAGCHTRINELEQQALDRTATLARQMAEIAALQSERDRLLELRRELAQERAARVLLEQELHAHAAPSTTPDASAPQAVAAPASAPEAVPVVVPEQASVPAVEPVAAATAVPRARARSYGPDDLEQIHGVGPKIARVLRKQGIRSFHQLAHLDEAGLKRLAAALPGFAQRIQREDWVGQSLKLHAQKYGTSG